MKIKKWIIMMTVLQIIASKKFIIKSKNKLNRKLNDDEYEKEFKEYKIEINNLLNSNNIFLKNKDFYNFVKKELIENEIEIINSNEKFYNEHYKNIKTWSSNDLVKKLKISDLENKIITLDKNIKIKENEKKSVETLIKSKEKYEKILKEINEILNIFFNKNNFKTEIKNLIDSFTEGTNGCIYSSIRNKKILENYKNILNSLTIKNPKKNEEDNLVYKENYNKILEWNYKLLDLKENIKKKELIKEIQSFVDNTVEKQKIKLIT